MTRSRLMLTVLIIAGTLSLDMSAAPPQGAKTARVYLENNSSYDVLYLYVDGEEVNCAARKGGSDFVSVPAGPHRFTARYGKSGSRAVVYGPEDVALTASRNCTWRVPGEPNDGCK